MLDKFDTDRDGRISRAEAEAVTEIDISGTWDDFSARKGVTSLEGIQYFPNLRKLICAANDIAALDLAQNRELEELDCCANSLTQLDLTQNTKLKSSRQAQTMKPDSSRTISRSSRFRRKGRWRSCTAEGINWLH